MPQVIKYDVRQKTSRGRSVFALDCLKKMEIKRLLNGLWTNIEWTTHGHWTDRTVHGPVHFTYAWRRCLSQISNSASRLHVCNREFERDPVLKPWPVEQYYKRVGRNRSMYVQYTLKKHFHTAAFNHPHLTTADIRRSNRCLTAAWPWRDRLLTGPFQQSVLFKRGMRRHTIIV